MSNLFEIKLSKLDSKKTIILGYAPSFCKENSFFFSPLRLETPYQINYEVGTEEGVIALLCNLFYPQKYNLDLGYLSAESNVGEEELEELLEFINQENIDLVLTQDFLTHPALSNILEWTKVLSAHPQIRCLIQDNTPLLDFELSECNGLVARIEYGENILIGSPQFARLGKLEDQNKINIAYLAHQCNVTFLLDPSMKGTIGILKVNSPFEGYPYQKIKLI